MLRCTDVVHVQRFLSEFLGLTSGALFPDDARHYRVDVLEAPNMRFLTTHPATRYTL